jgi:hypothetical protein
MQPSPVSPVAVATVPVAFSGGKSERFVPVAGEILCTCPINRFSGNLSICILVLPLCFAQAHYLLEATALSSRVLEALEHCLGGRDNRNLLRSPIEHSNGEGAIDDAKYRRGRPLVRD